MIIRGSDRKQEKSQIRVTDLRIAECEKWIELSVLLNNEALNWKEKKLWFRFPSELSAHITANYDPFVAALLPLAMKTNSNLVISGTVSQLLFEQTNQIIKIFDRWFTSMHAITIKVASTQRHWFDAKVVGSFFTGGADSFYTVLKNLNFYKNESRISHLIYVHGFDIPLDNEHLFEQVRNEIIAAASEFQLKPVFIKTNLRQLTDRYVRWGEEQHGAALASAALGLSKLFKIVYIPSSVSFSELYPWGSHPVIDTLWSNEQLQFIHDGNEANRSQKMLWQISKSETALKYLRVCWKNPENKYNCGTCGKCIRTKVNLKIADVLDKCRTLDNDINYDIYEKILLRSSVEMRNLRVNIALMDGNLPLKKKLQELKQKVESKQNRVDYRLKKILKKFSDYFRAIS